MEVSLKSTFDILSFKFIVGAWWEKAISCIFADRDCVIEDIFNLKLMIIMITIIIKNCDGINNNHNDCSELSAVVSDSAE